MDKKNKKNLRTYIDSDVVESDGSMSSDENSGERKKRALKKLKNKVDDQLLKTVHERADNAEKYGSKEDKEKALKKLKLRKELLKK